jgi:hypothetical protein
MTEYWVRICRTCGTVDDETLPPHHGGPPVEPTLLGQPGRDRLPEWRCKTCGGAEFRVDSWNEGA